MNVGAVVRVELRKLAAQAVVRVVALLCVVVPFAFVGVLRLQSGVPADTLFGIWVHKSGFAVSLAVLGFAGTWAFPVLTSLVAGDIFASEDRHSTWKTLLTRSCSRGELFAGKALAAATYSALILVLLAVSSLAAGAVATGTQPLVSLSGSSLAPGHSLGLVLASWASLLLPVLAFTSIGLLLSVTTGNGIVAILATAGTALISQLLSLTGGGEIVRALLPVTPFEAWHGLVVEPAFYRPLEQGAIVSAAYVVACVWIAWAVFRRRDFAGSTARRRRSWATPTRVVALAAVLVALLALASRWGPSRLTAGRLESSIAPNFANLTLLQQRLLGRFVPAGAQLNVLPSCKRRGVSTPRRGPGDNWFCTLNLVGRDLRQKPINYEVTVKTNGCYTADGVPTVIGPATIPDARGHQIVNPLFRIDGCFDPSGAWP